MNESTQNLCEYIRNQSTRYERSVFLSYECSDACVDILYDDLPRLIYIAARYLGDMGVSDRDRVLLFLDNQPNLIIFSFACAYLGAVGVIGNSRLKKGEVDYLIEDSEPKLVITSGEYEKNFDSNSSAYLLKILSGKCFEDEAFSGCEENGWGKEKFNPMAIDNLQPALIFYTSGTTDKAKGVVITHELFIWAANSNAQCLSLDNNDVVLMFLPLCHVLAYSYQMLSSLASGGKVVLLDKFNPVGFWAASSKHKCTWTALVPFVWQILIRSKIPQENTYKFWIPAIKYPELEQKFNIPTLGWWGMTELFAIGCVGDSKTFSGPAYAIGKFVPGNDYKFSDSEVEETPVGARTKGNIIVKGEPGKTIFLGYLNKDQATQESFDENGYFITGDSVLQDDEGSITFDNRLKDIIKVLGENVSAREVEVAIQFSGLAQEVAVVAKPDSLYGEICAAFVIPRNAELSESEIKKTIHAACTERLADFKRPKEIHLVKELPRSELGKVAKNKLRESLIA